MKRFLIASIAGFALLAGTAGEVRANGRFPESNQLVFSKDDPNLVMLRVTFGLLVSHDRGKTFDWVCEQSIGYSGIEDPMYASTPSGQLIATTFQGLSTSANQGCDWSFAGGELQQQVFIDLAANPADRKDIVAFASSYLRQTDAGNILFSSKVWETKDEGRTFAPLGDALDTSLLGYTIDFTATDPNRLYITAVRNPGPTGMGLLLTSKDHGKTWTEQEIPLVNTERSLFIAAVDPADAEKVYIRTNNNPDAPGRLILREKDPAGDNGVFRTLFTSKSPLTGFALSPDAKKLWIGSSADGIYLANTSDYQFAQQSDIEVQCLTATDDGLWACSNEKVGFIAGRSTDDGKTFQPVLHFCTIRGPLSCSQGSMTNTQCAPVWAAQRDTLGCGGDDDDDGGQQSSGGQGDGGAVIPRAATTTTTKSCDCQSVIPSSSWSNVGGAAAAVLGAAAAIIRRRSRRRRAG